MIIRLALVLVVVASAGCTRWRLVIDAVPAEDDLVETEVLRDPGASGSSPKIALINLTGIIVDSDRRRFGFPGENPVDRFVESLRKAETDHRVSGVLIRVNSPGGTVTASDIVYREIKQFKARSGKPVVILMGAVAASGGYYVSCAADEVLAYPTTVTGSIGVIIQTFNFSEGMRKIGISADAITSGPNKAMGSPFEPVRAEHRAILQGLVDEFYDNFMDVVVSSRPEVSSENLQWITDGRVVSGAAAAEAGIIDGLGDLRTAYDAVKKRAGVARARLIKYHRPVEHVGSPYARSPTGDQFNLLQLNIAADFPNQPGFYYLWDATGLGAP